HFEGDFVGATMLGTTQGTNTAGNGGVHVGTRASNDAAGKGGGVELVLCVQNQGSVHGTYPFVAWFFTVQQVQEVAANAVVISLNIDVVTIVAEVVPVQQSRAQAGHQAISNVAGVGQVVVVFFWQDATQYRYRSAHDIHRMAGCRQGFQC